MRVVLFLMVACKGAVVPTGPDSTDGPTDGPTDQPVPTPVETMCDDGTDDDGDGMVDCLDSDCAAETYCAWPISGIEYSVRASYTPNSLAEFAGYSACVIETSAVLVRDRAESCDGCDRVYCGAITISTDTCPSDFDRPTQGCYGFAFTSDSSWDVWFQNDVPAYETLGTAVESTTVIGLLEYSGTQNVVVEGIDGGSLTLDFGFRSTD